MSPRRADELWDRSRRLEAERLRPERPAPTPANDPLRKLIATLAGLLANPGPPDPETKIGKEAL